MAKKIIVCQTGSRHRYLIPQVLERNGMLSRLYTDSTCYSTLGSVAKLMQKLGRNNATFARLLKRKPQIPRAKLFTTDRLFWKKRFWGLFGKDSLRQRYLHYRGFVGRCMHWGVGDADCIYNMYIENFDFLKYAKSKGLKIAVDIYETPMTYKYLIDEIDNNPEFSVFQAQREAYSYSHEVRMHYMEDLLKLADCYTIPSQFVIKLMSEFKNFDSGKVRFLPYASSIVTSEYSYKPIKHRLIWVGNDAIRKGLIYCAKAATLLKEKYADLDFRIIGVVDKRIQEHPTFKDLNFLGVLNKEQLTEEYRCAEAYVFPTLFEGFAGTVIEAASCGCPIVTTECAGTDVSEFPALYIPTKDVNAIVDSVERIFNDAPLRDTLSRNVYGYAKKLTPETYEKRLVEYLRDL